MKTALFLTITLFVQGCSLVHYKSHGLSKSHFSFEEKNCELSYFIEVVGFHKELAHKVLSQYKSSAKETLDAIGCNSKVVTERSKADLVVHVKHKRYGDAAGQEFLTGLSLGLIPSWFTRENMYTYTISEQAKSKTYKLDHVSYNHLIFFPFIWLNLFTDNEQEHFSSALTDFIRNT